MRRISIALLLIAMIALPVQAQDVKTENPKVQRIIEQAKDGYYYETIIEVNPALKSGVSGTKASTKTGTKTVNYKNSAGVVMWYVKVTGTFTYGNGSATCTSSTVSAASNNKCWKIASKSSSKTGNKAKASATAKQYQAGVLKKTMTKNVTLTCSSNGTLS